MNHKLIKLFIFYLSLLSCSEISKNVIEKNNSILQVRYLDSSSEIKSIEESTLTFSKKNKNVYYFLFFCYNINKFKVLSDFIQGNYNSFVKEENFILYNVEDSELSNKGNYNILIIIIKDGKQITNKLLPSLTNDDLNGLLIKFALTNKNNITESHQINLKGNVLLEKSHKLKKIKVNMLNITSSDYSTINKDKLIGNDNSEVPIDKKTKKILLKFIIGFSICIVTLLILAVFIQFSVDWATKSQANLYI